MSSMHIVMLSLDITILLKEFNYVLPIFAEFAN